LTCVSQGIFTNNLLLKFFPIVTMDSKSMSGIGSCFPKLSSKTKTILFFIVVITSLILATPASAQQQFEWSKTYADSQGESKCVISTNDGGYAIAGDSNGQILLAKADFSGEVVWWKTYQPGEATCVIQTSDGGYAVGGRGDVNFIKTDSLGNVEWSKSYTYNNATYKITTFQVMGLAQTRDGGYILAGKTPTGPLLGWDLTLRTDSQGDVIWSKTYGTKWGNSLATDVLVVDDGYILAANALLYKLNENGNVQWSQPTSFDPASLAKTSDGGYLLCRDTTLTKTDPGGKAQWSKSYLFESARGSVFQSAIQTRDGGFIACGFVFPVWEGVAWIVKTDSAGNQKWDITSSTIAGQNSKAFSIIEVRSGVYVVTGSIVSISNSNNSEIWLAKVSGPVFPDSSPIVSPSPTPSVSEFSYLTILPILLAIPIAMAIVRKRLQRNV
jgi:hypothetical protein